MEIQSLNRNLTNQKIHKPYPNINLLDPSDAVAWVVPALPAGDIPILCTYQGKTAQIGKCAKSALALNTLRKISRIEMHFNPDNIRSINSSEDIMDVLEAL